MKKAPRLSSRRLILIGGLLLLFAGGGPFVGYTQTSCTPREAWQGWTKCSIVPYCLDSNLSTTQQTAIQNAITAWNTENQSNNSKVKFVTAGASGCKLTFKNDSAIGSTVAAMTNVVTTNGKTTSATTKFNLNAVFAGTTTPWFNTGDTTNFPIAFKKVVMHEIGHTMGLAETSAGNACPQTDDLSIMNGFCGTNDSSNNMPTVIKPCNNTTINTESGYPAGGCYKCSGSTCTQDDVNGTALSCAELSCGGGGGGGGCEFIDFDGDGWDLCEDCDDDFYDPSNECAGGEGCPCIRDYDCDLCNEGYCEIGLQECFAYTPILIDINGDGYRMTSASGGVAFDFRGNGSRDSLSWTAAGSDDAWLALDRNGNGMIDNGAELFGSATPQAHTTVSPNGFVALAHYDRTLTGGNIDRLIDSGDAIFSSLRLWQDMNHNGISEPSELHTLPELGVDAISLDYRESRRRDQYGNWFRYRSKVFDVRGALVGRWAWDVILTRLRPLNR